MMAHAGYQHVGSPYIRLIEECSELIKALCKADRFGLDSYHPAIPEVTNWKAILDEMADVERIIAEVRGRLTLAAERSEER